MSQHYQIHNTPKHKQKRTGRTHSQTKTKQAFNIGEFLDGLFSNLIEMNVVGFTDCNLTPDFSELHAILLLNSRTPSELQSGEKLLLADSLP